MLLFYYYYYSAAAMGENRATIINYVRKTSLKRLYEVCTRECYLGPGTRGKTSLPLVPGTLAGPRNPALQREV